MMNELNHRVNQQCNHKVIFKNKPLGYNSEMKEENDSNEPPIAARLYHLMKKTGVNKSGLARICGVSPQAAGRWFTKGKMSKDSALKLSEAFGVSLSWLLSDDVEFDEQPALQQISLTERHKELINLFDRLPESEQDHHIESLRSTVNNYDRLFDELLKSRNINKINKLKNAN